MEKELLAIFTKTIRAHFPQKAGIAKDDYLSRFKAVLLPGGLRHQEEFWHSVFENNHAWERW